MIGQTLAHYRITAGDAFRLFEARAAGRSTMHPGYSVSPDGRFLFHLLDPRAVPNRIDVVLDWFGELEAQVPRS